MQYCKVVKVQRLVLMIMSGVEKMFQCERTFQDENRLEVCTLYVNHLKH